MFSAKENGLWQTLGADASALISFTESDLTLLKWLPTNHASQQ